MSRVTPKLRGLAERLIAFETTGKSSKSAGAPAFLACEKLRPHLATLMGNVGFRSLLSRALVLAGAGVQWLRAVHVNADGSLDGLDELHDQLDAGEFLEGAVVLHSQLLGLLATFIGEILTLQLLREVWPKLPLDDLDFENGAKNEKTK